MSGPGPGAGPLKVECPLCCASPGDRCLDGPGYPRLADDCHEMRVRSAERASHAALVSALEEADDALRLVSCEQPDGRCGTELHDIETLGEGQRCSICRAHDTVRAALRAEGRG